MKQKSRLLSLVTIVALIFTMSFAMCSTVFAADNGKITVDNAIKDETYTLYKVFDAKSDGSDAISYKSTWMTTSNDYFAVDSKGNITIKDAGKDPTDETKLSDAAIAWLKTQISNFTQVGDPKVASGTTVEWTGLADGYYYINTTTGSFVTIDSVRPDATVEEKNTIPSGDKSQSATKSGTYADTTLHMNIGDTVYYKYVITNGKGSDKNIKVTDTMTNGLDLQSTITVKDKEGSALVKDTDYTLTTTDHGFVLTLLEAYVKTMGTNDTVTVEYSAKINKNAVVDNATGNSNNAKFEYSGQTTEETIYVATYDFQLYKTDGKKYLPGSGFKLYDAATGGNQITVSKDDTGYYRDADGSASTQIMVESADGVNVRGLAPGKYYLEETTTPDGYNTLTKREEVTITSGDTAAAQVTVVNEAGTELPSTGGIGTTIFYIIGAALVIGCAVILVSRRRIRNK